VNNILGELKWLTAASASAGILNGNGVLQRTKGTFNGTLDLWNGTIAPAGFVNAGFTAMPASVLTSQGLA
jgi:hypothetical protein